MEKIFFEKLSRLIMASLCFGISLIFIRILPFEWLHYAAIYDILAMCCGFISAAILVSYNIFKASCIAGLLFIVYFLFFQVSIMAIITALSAFIIQIISIYVPDKIKVTFIILCLGIMALIAYCNNSVRLEFLLEFVFWWHTLWFVLLFVAFKILRGYNAK